MGTVKIKLSRTFKSFFDSEKSGGILLIVCTALSLFITNLAFAGEPEVINASKMAILLASLTAGTVGFLWLKPLGKPEEGDVDMDTMDFAEAEA